MKKLVISGMFGIGILFLSSCGGGRHICPAYGGQSDMTKKQHKTTENVQLVEALSQAKYRDKKMGNELH